MKRALVVSGGGSKGAFAAGLAAKLYERNYRWDNFYGTSTGALVNLLIARNEFEELKQVYTSVTNKDIFNKPPFNQNGKLNLHRILWRILTGKTAIGEANNLLDLIKNTYNQEQHDKTIIQGKRLAACVTNYTDGKVEFCYNELDNYETFIKYVFASASVPVAMDLVKIGDCEYLDGGVMEHIPLQQAINDGSDEIDVIVLRPDYTECTNKWKSKNSISVILRTIELMMKEISESNLFTGLKNTHDKNIKINIFYVPNNIDGNSLVFDQKIMKEWWYSGYNVKLDFWEEPIFTKSSKSSLSIKNYKIQL